MSLVITLKIQSARVMFSKSDILAMNGATSLFLEFVKIKLLEEEKRFKNNHIIRKNDFSILLIFEHLLYIVGNLSKIK